MQRKVSRQDFEGAAHLNTDLSEGGLWGVCDDYEIRGDQIVAKFSYRDFERWKTYMPLTETPDLFLRFARLCEQSNLK